MPTYKRFDGFSVEVRSREHNPPHFHVIGTDFHALIGIRDLQVMKGKITRQALAIIVPWAAAENEALMTE